MQYKEQKTHGHSLSYAAETIHPISGMQGATLCLASLMILQQVISGPVLKHGGRPGEQSDSGSLKRVSRMSPLWRSITSKPHGAFCQDHYECTTQICRDGHCSFSHIVHS